MIELINVEQINEEKFNLQVFVDSEVLNFVIEAKETTIGKQNEDFWYIVSEDKSFYEIWGQSLDFRKAVSDSIKIFKKEAKDELQPV